jgi:hypothetical protein
VTLQTAGYIKRKTSSLIEKLAWAENTHVLCSLPIVEVIWGIFVYAVIVSSSNYPTRSMYMKDYFYKSLVCDQSYLKLIKKDLNMIYNRK